MKGYFKAAILNMVSPFANGIGRRFHFFAWGPIEADDAEMSDAVVAGTGTSS